MAQKNPTGQAPTGTDRALQAAGDPAMIDEDQDWERFAGEDPEGVYSQAGESAGPTSGAEAPNQQTGTNPAPESLNEVDFSEMSLEDRVATVRAFVGNDQLPQQAALDIADGYMRNSDYTQSKQTLAEQHRMTQQLLQQAGYQPPESRSQMDSFLQAQASPMQQATPNAPMPPQPRQPQPAAPQQGNVPGPPPGTVSPDDMDGFEQWWSQNRDEPPKMADYQRWYHDQTFGQQQRQQAQRQLEQTVNEAQSEWAEIESEFSHAKEPGVREAVEQAVLQRLHSGQAYPGMVREIYLGNYAQPAFERKMLDSQQPPQAPGAQGQQQGPRPQPRRQAPPVPPGGPGGAQRPPQEPDLSTDEGILQKQMNDDGFLQSLEGTLQQGETSVYDEAAAQMGRG